MLKRGFLYTTCLLLVIALILVTPSLGGTEQQNEQQDTNAIFDAAYTAAKQDAKNDFDAVLWFLAGNVPMMGSVAGMIGGCCIGTAIGSGGGLFFFLPSGAEMVGCCVGGTALGLTSLSLVRSNINNVRLTSRTTERLIGKPPKYVEHYTGVYKRETIRLRKSWAVIGGSTTALIGGGALFLMYQKQW